MCKASIVLLILLATLGGCQEPNKPTTQPSPYETIGRDPQRDSTLAGQMNAKATDLIKKCQYNQAEKELTKALTADMFFGPAHNNLGLVRYYQKKYYEAAWEFQYAIKLMPNKAEPKNNLGLVFEAVGKLDDAAKYYEEALQLEPQDVESTANLARVYVKTNKKDDRTRKLLGDIVMRDERPQWVAWAREHLVLLGKGQVGQATTRPSLGG